MVKVKNSRLDYSELVEVILKNDMKAASHLSSEIIPRLIDYLRVAHGADSHAAEECAHQAFANVYEQIMQNKIQKPVYVFRYLIQACKNEYFKYSRKEKRYSFDDDDTLAAMCEPAEQVENLIDEERQQLLSECLNELDQKSKDFILYFLNYPDTTVEEVCKKFNMSNANVRTKKSRLLKKLHNTYKRKSDAVPHL
ncbi:MAG: RNA polymerase sigma factor [Balneolaceae bacterium]